MPNYTLPNDTLKNRLGLEDADELDRAEAAYTALRLAEIKAGYGPKGQFDADHLQAIHHHIFQDVYEWAGHTRDERIALADGTIATEPTLRKVGGQPFLIGPAIPAALDDIGRQLDKADQLRGLSREQFAEQAADVMIALNAVHPFREGNGRTQRVFMEQLAQQAGHNLDFTVISKERMVQASIAANEQGDPSMMRRMFDEISDPARVVLLQESITALEKLNFKWNDRYIATLQPGHTVDLVLAGISGDQFMGRTNDQILFGKTADLPDPRPQRGERFTVTARDDHAPLTANQIQNRFGDPDLEARFTKGEQHKRQNSDRAATASDVPARATGGEVPAEKREEFRSRATRDAKGGNLTRDAADNDAAPDRAPDRGGPTRGGGRGGRGR